MMDGLPKRRRRNMIDGLPKKKRRNMMDGLPKKKERNMMDEKIDDVDMISDMPAFIMHHILSFLPRKEAAKTSVLSKKWNSIWSSFPVLDFDQRCYLSKDHLFVDRRAENKKRVEKFMNIVDKSFGRFQEHKLQLQKFKLHITLVDFELASLVDKWIELAFENDAKEIDFLVLTEENTCYTLPKTIFVAKSTNYCKLGQPFLWTGVKFYSLQKLRLQEVCVNEEIIQDIIHTCPFITDFGLINFKGLKILEISKLPKLRNVTVIPHDNYVESVKIDLPNLQIFRLEYLHQCQLDITGCKDLKELWLDSVNITDQLFHFSISRFPHLETLLINHCNMLERVNISVQRLRELRIFSCQKLLDVEIDAPNLSFFRYWNSSNEMAKLFLKNAPCCLELNLKLGPNDLVDTHWFLNLREFLLMSNQRKYLKILVFLSGEVTFDLKELSGMSLPPPVELDLMKLDVRKSSLSIDYVTFIDGLLWSCRPKILSVPTGLESGDKCIKVLCEMLVDREDLHRCSGDHKCWRSHLKGAKISSIAGNEDERLLDCKTLLDMLPTLAKGQEIQLRLDWEHHLHGYLD